MSHQSPNTDVPDDYFQHVAVCRSLDEIFRSDTFCYVFIQTLRGGGISNKDIANYLRAYESIRDGAAVNDGEMLALRDLLKKEDVIDRAQKEFQKLQFTGVDHAARKNLATYLYTEYGHRDLTAQQLMIQVVAKIYPLLSHEVLSGIPDVEVASEQSRCNNYECRFLESFVCKKYNIVTVKNRFMFERGYIYGAGITHSGRRIVFHKGEVIDTTAMSEQDFLEKYGR